MKKSFLILFAVAVGLSACQKNTYVDGTYKVSFNEPSHSYTGFIELTLADDAISSVVFDYMNDTVDLLKSDDEAYATRMINYGASTTPDVFLPAIADLLEASTILPEFVPIDAYTGATGSSADANALMEAALDLAVEGETTETTIAQLEEE